MAVVKIVYEPMPLNLTPEEEMMLEEIAERYDVSRIDGREVYWITSETIPDYLFDIRPEPEERAILESLDRKLKSYLGDDFDATDFFLE